MTPADRTRMRETLRTALRKTLLPEGAPTHPGAFALSADDASDPVARFTQELTALGGTVHEATGLDRLAATVLSIVDAQPVRRVLSWDQAALPVPGLLDRLASAGVQVLTERPGELASPEKREEWASASVGITGADAGLVETGSVVLASGPGRGRLASLLTPIHVALLSHAALVRSLAVLIAERPDLVTRGSNLICITGPSRTADIEHTLSRGVHGPKEVHVVLYK
jgi:L-lactate dehydrogenase complex protein LldG